ncbi:MAG: DUF2723 domain-containing protein [Polyangiales bacterium]
MPDPDAAPPAPPPASPPAWAADLAFALPAALGLLGAGGSMGFFDAPELATSAMGVGVTHPPGHPLWVAVSALARMLPLGPVPFRVALMSGLCLGLTGRLAFGFTHRLARASLAESPALHRWAAPLALGAALLSVLGVAPFAQATRVEVYALAGLLGVALLAASRAPSLSPAARARASVLLHALGGANHHFIAITTAPAALWALGDRLRRGGFTALRRGLIPWAVLGVIGLLPYALLPLRARAAASIVRVRTVGDLWWTVTARAFQKNIGAGVPGTFGENLLDVLDWAGTSLTPFGLLAAVGGLWFVVRRRDEAARDTRDDALALALVAFAGVAARASLGFVAHNPDAAGYLVPAVVALGALGAGFSSRALAAIANAPPAPEGPSRAARAVLVAALVAAPSLAFAPAALSAWRATAPDRGDAPEVITASAWSSVPPRATVLAYAPETAFRLRYAAQVEGERPDVSLVMVPFLPWPGATNALLARDPSLRALVLDQLSHGAPRTDTLTELAQARPLRVELDPHNLIAMIPYVLPRGVLAELRGEPTTLAAVRATAVAHFAAHDALVRALGERPGDLDAPKTREYLLWRSYNDAVFFAGRGARPEARASLRRALAIAPRAAELLGLSEALDAPGEGPIDVRLWLVGGGARRARRE